MGHGDIGAWTLAHRHGRRTRLKEECAFMSRRFSMLVTLAVVTLGIAGTAGNATAQKPVTLGVEVTETAVIVAIDSTARLVTLRGEDGTLDSVYCGPDVKRFDELKVGDKVTFRYHESMVFAVQKPGATPPADTTGITRSEGGKPGGTIAQQMTAVVTVLAIDLKTPSITIQNADGSKMSFKVDDKKNLEGVKVGDKVQITYTQALAISVAPAS
jgi:Cu/Ag efflux protein CusF